MEEWRKLLIDFVKLHGPEIINLKKLESELRQFKKSIEGTTANPSEYTIGKKAIVENWDSILELTNNVDTEDLIIDTNGTNPKLKVKCGDDYIEISVTERETLDSKAIFDEMVLDGVITIDQLMKYKEKNTKTSKSFSIK